MNLLALVALLGACCALGMVVVAAKSCVGAASRRHGIFVGTAGTTFDLTEDVSLRQRFWPGTVYLPLDQVLTLLRGRGCDLSSKLELGSNVRLLVSESEAHRVTVGGEPVDGECVLTDSTEIVIDEAIRITYKEEQDDDA